MTDFETLAKLLAPQLRSRGTRIELEGEIVRVARDPGSILLADAEMLSDDQDRSEELLEEVRKGETLLIAVGELDSRRSQKLLDRGVYDVRGSAHPARLASAIRNALDMQALRGRARVRAAELRRYRYELGEIIEIARAISSERNIDSLLETILEKTRFVTAADAGSLYVVEGKGPIETRSLRFKLSHCDSHAIDWKEFVIPISHRSMAGAAALERRLINISDVNDLPNDGDLHYDRTFDERAGYHTRSVLSAPMISQSGEVIGVVQLINRKRDGAAVLLRPEDFDETVIPFGPRCEELVQTLAAHAGVSLENALLYANISSLFEGLVTASAHAIEQRDPTTSGHSTRVAELTCALAEVVSDDEGTFEPFTFSAQEMLELRYAALLHDFGKIGVREELLVKARKLPPRQLEVIAGRFEAARLSLRCLFHEERAGLVAAGATEADLEAAEEGLHRALGKLDAAFESVVSANEATFMNDGGLAQVDDLEELSFCDSTGEEKRLLTDEELTCLRIRRGSLTKEEYGEICTHAKKTVEYLDRIPWGSAFSELPLIAGSHHERLDGSGYPEGLEGVTIPIQAKIMAVADIFDALTASDRPYKKAVPAKKALEILQMEVKAGHLDADLVELFAASGLHRLPEREP